MQHLPYSKIIRIYREKQKLTLRQLSDITFFGFQTLSKYEIELIPLSDENFEVIARAVNIDYSLVYYVNETLKNDLNHLYECIVYDYSDEIEGIVKRIKKSNEYIPYSDLHHYYLVLMFSLDIINGKEESPFLNEILHMKDHFDSNMIQIFYDYYAIHTSRQGKLTDAIEIINRALSLGKRSLISAMLNYHAGLLNSIQGNLKTSLEHNLEAEHLFIQEHNHIRLISVQTNIATIYARQKNLDQALEIYYRLLKEAVRSKNSDIEIVTRYNIAWCLK
ncbi:MAG: helix-turn-helix domain-containing protein, partial [Erysipelotrichaceae bacterium]